MNNNDFDLNDFIDGKPTNGTPTNETFSPWEKEKEVNKVEERKYNVMTGEKKVNNDQTQDYYNKAAETIEDLDIEDGSTSILDLDLRNKAVKEAEQEFLDNPDWTTKKDLTGRYFEEDKLSFGVKIKKILFRADKGNERIEFILQILNKKDKAIERPLNLAYKYSVSIRKKGEFNSVELKQTYKKEFSLFWIKKLLKTFQSLNPFNASDKIITNLQTIARSLVLLEKGQSPVVEEQKYIFNKLKEIIDKQEIHTLNIQKKILWK